MSDFDDFAPDMTTQEASQTKGADFVKSLARGLLVIRSFDDLHGSQTLSDVARRTGLNRATSRRLLLTLSELGYVVQKDRHFSLGPAVLQLGYAYLSSMGASAIAQPFLEKLSDDLGESCSMAVLDGAEVVYVARVPTKRIFSVALVIGSRLPAYTTSTGRVLLAHLPEAEVDRILASSDFRKRTAKSLDTPEQVKEQLPKIAERGWSLIDEELELGLRAVAAPVRDDTGRVIAAINVSMTVVRTPFTDIETKVVPKLLQTADHISFALSHR